MKQSFSWSAALPVATAATLLLLSSPSYSHVALESRSAPAGSSYKAALVISHGCNGSPTTGVSVQIPPGFRGAKPYPKAGWMLSVQTTQLAVPYQQHGRRVTEDVTAISWTATSPEAALPDHQVDDFAWRGTLPESAGPLWFKVLQTCAQGSTAWHDIPPSGDSRTALKLPAALLEVTSPVAPAAAAPRVPAAHAAGAHGHAH